MSTTPKAVILAVVIFLGLIVLGVIAGTVALQLTDNGALPNDVGNLGLVALGALAGVLATTRTTPELPPGAVVTQGQTTITTPTTAQNEGETASGTPVAPIHTPESVAVWELGADGIAVPPAHQVPDGPAPA